MQQRYRLHLLGVLKVYKFQISTRVYLSQIRCLDPPFPPSPRVLLKAVVTVAHPWYDFFIQLITSFCHNLDINKKNRKRKTQLGKLLFLLSRQHWHKIKQGSFFHCVNFLMLTYRFFKLKSFVTHNNVTQRKLVALNNKNTFFAPCR